ncbi:MAG: MarR family winged helix-turn-helix transcriptional regulator [Planctomycetota bacterium]
MSDKYLKHSAAVAQLVIASQRIYKAVTALMRKYELTESQYNALRVLRGAASRSEDLTQAELADRLIASRANTTWILDKLEDRRLVRRRGHSDRRKNLIEITAAGQDLLQSIDPEFEALIGGVLKNVSDAELDRMLAVIGKFEFAE